MCMFSRKEKRLKKQVRCFNSASGAAQVSIHSADTLSALSIEVFLENFLLFHPRFFSWWPIS